MSASVIKFWQTSLSKNLTLFSLTIRKAPSINLLLLRIFKYHCLLCDCNWCRSALKRLMSCLVLIFSIKSRNLFSPYLRSLRRAVRPSRMKVPVFKWIAQETLRGCFHWEWRFHFITFLQMVAQVYSKNLEGPMLDQEGYEKSAATTIWSQWSITCDVYQTKPSQKVRHCADLHLWQRYTLRILLPIERWPHLHLPDIWALNSTNHTSDLTSTHCRSQRGQ